MAKKRTHPLIEGLFSFQGRMRRSEFWVASIGLGVVKIPLNLLGLVFGAEGSAIVRMLVELLFIWPGLAIMVKRGHDRNRPAAFSLGVQALLFVAAAVFGAAPDESGLKYAMAALLAVLLLYMLVDYGFIDGTQGPNRYGRSPKGIGGDPEDKLAEVFA